MKCLDNWISDCVFYLYFYTTTDNNNNYYPYQRGISCFAGAAAGQEVEWSSTASKIILLVCECPCESLYLLSRRCVAWQHLCMTGWMLAYTINCLQRPESKGTIQGQSANHFSNIVEDTHSKYSPVSIFRLYMWTSMVQVWNGSLYRCYNKMNWLRTSYLSF